MMIGQVLFHSKQTKQIFFFTGVFFSLVATAGGFPLTGSAAVLNWGPNFILCSLSVCKLQWSCIQFWSNCQYCSVFANLLSCIWPHDHAHIYSLSSFSYGVSEVQIAATMLCFCRERKLNCRTNLQTRVCQSEISAIQNLAFSKIMDSFIIGLSFQKLCKYYICILNPLVRVEIVLKSWPGTTWPTERYRSTAWGLGTTDI